MMPTVAISLIQLILLIIKDVGLCQKLRHNHTGINTFCANDKIMTTPTDKAEALKQHFVSVFTNIYI